jgi:hypothetical protein
LKGEYPIGPDDITVIWLMAFTGHSGHALDLRVTDLTIRSGSPILTPPAQVVESAPEPRPRHWRLVVAISILLLGGAVGIWWSMRRRDDKAAAPEPRVRKRRGDEE